MNLLLEKLISLRVADVNLCMVQFERYYKLLIYYNSLFNLTAITQKDQVEQKHFIDSLASAYSLHGSVLDIGSGAGFPGLPLAIALQELSFTLVESSQKKAAFLQKVVEELGLRNVLVKNGRIEEFNKTEKFDFMVSRALAPLSTLCEYGLPFLEIGGTLIAYKGMNYKEEIKSAQNALTVLGGEISGVDNYSLTKDAETLMRSLIYVKKVTESSDKYPRSGNKPRLKPL